jgi:hypothetical protein
MLSACSGIPVEKMIPGAPIITTGGRGTFEEVPMTSIETKSAVFMISYIRWEPVMTEGGQHSLKCEWFNGEKLASESESYRSFNVGKSPFRAWCRAQAAGLGVGHIHTRMWIDDRMMAASEFDVIEVSAKPSETHAEYSAPAGTNTAGSPASGGNGPFLSHCPNAVAIAKDVGFPSDAASKGLTAGSVVMAIVLTPTSGVHDVRVVSSTDPSFNQAAIDAVSRLQCNGTGLPKDTEYRWEMNYQAR